ncbi:MAG: hypothetical protein UDY71_02075 [Slackia isoflavoniconvertens]|nr:hypothetical protein [Slackia isoflavoniconvertens]
MISCKNRRETTAELSAKVLKKLRRDFNLVASEVWVDEAHRVDFVAYRCGIGYANAAAERGAFCFVEVKSCMDDFTSGHGRTFEGDENWLVCPRELADALHEKMQLPRNCKVMCPDAAGRLRVAYDTSEYGQSSRKLSTAALLCQMVLDSAESWRTSREVFYEEARND